MFVIVRCGIRIVMLMLRVLKIGTNMSVCWLKIRKIPAKMQTLTAYSPKTELQKQQPSHNDLRKIFLHFLLPKRFQRDIFNFN